LRGNPGNHLEGVILFLRQIFTEERALGVTAAAHVDPEARVAVSGKIGVAEGITWGRPIILAVRDIFEQGGNRMAMRIQG
jgi:hypothetical protein